MLFASIHQSQQKISHFSWFEQIYSNQMMGACEKIDQVLEDEEKESVALQESTWQKLKEIEDSSLEAWFNDDDLLNVKIDVISLIPSELWASSS